MISAYYYDSGDRGPAVQEVLAHFGTADEQTVDTAGWDEQRRREVYFSSVLPAATENGKAIADDLHDDGDVTFATGVLLTDDGDVHVGDAALTVLRDEV